MKALQLVEIGKPLQMRDIPLPSFGDRDVLIRVRAAGICHSDEHYRNGDAPVAHLPLTLGHEVAGVVEKTGKEVTAYKPGDRVCVHYLATCGSCSFCLSGHEQFCAAAEMIGKHRDGGYAEYLRMPAASLVELPPEIPFEHGAVLMCSTATAFHALRKGRLQAGERVAVFGAGGLGISAVQLARIMGAGEVLAVDIHDDKLKVAEKYGAIPVNASVSDPLRLIRDLTARRGVDVAVEVAGLAVTARQAVSSLGKRGRAVMVGLCDQPISVRPYSDLVGSEGEIIGCSDHLLSELPVLLEFARQGRLDLSAVAARSVPLEAGAVNESLDALHQFKGAVRTVIVPSGSD